MWWCVHLKNESRFWAGKIFAGKCDRLNLGTKIWKLLAIEPNQKEVFFFLLFHFHSVFPLEFSVWKSNGKSGLHPALIRKMELL